MGLIGPNGAGKTTLFNLITGFLRPTKGEIRFNGKNISREKPHAIAARGIVRTFQSTSIFPDFSVLRNVVVACHLRPRAGFWESVLHTSGYRCKEHQAEAYAAEILQFVGLQEVKNMPARRLSHGHKRVLGIALALAAKPQLLLLDEPLGGMNAEEVNHAKSIINRTWHKGVTIILIEHNMRATMNLCQRIVVLNFGEKIAEGVPEEIKSNKRVIEAYLGADEYAS